MKRALVTITYGDYFEEMARLTHPTLEAYARRVGADFIKWSDATGHTIPEYKKMEIGDLLEHYDRVLYVDTDIIIRPDAPDIFDVVPEDSLGMLEEGRYWDRRIGMLGYLSLIGVNADSWDGNYYNAGVMVASKDHREVFVRPQVEYDHFREQTWLNAMIYQRKTKMFQLPYRFNRLVNADPIYGESRLDAWFVHYAGVQFRMSVEHMLQLIQSDLAIWRQFPPGHRFQQNIVIMLQGGLGDQVAAEPTVRYAREVFYPTDNLVAICIFPQLLGHLNLPVHTTHETVSHMPHYRARFTGIDPDMKDALVRHQIHPTTLASLVALGTELPAEYKRPRLAVDPRAVERVTALVPSTPLEQLVLLHPGHGLPPNTFPPDVWQSYADALVQAGYTVAVIGRRVSHAKGIVEFDRSRCIDLIDRLDIDELIALISRARVLISNDSGPVQIAGAFDGWIGLIATLRNPRYVLPWRQGSQTWRAAGLEQQPLYVDYLQRPSGGETPRLDVCDEARLRECLPEPGAILAFVSAAFAGD